MDAIVTVVSIALILYALNPFEPCFKRRIPKAKGVIKYESWSSNDADDENEENEENKDPGEWKERSEKGTENEEGNAIINRNKVQKFPVESIDDEDQEGTMNKFLSEGREEENEYMQTDKSDEYVQTDKSDEYVQWHQNEDINEAIEKESLPESESTVSGLDEADEVDSTKKRVNRISKKYVDEEKYIC